LNSIMSSESLFIRIENELVLARDVDADSVVYKGFFVIDCEVKEVISQVHVKSTRRDATHS